MEVETQPDETTFPPGHERPFPRSASLKQHVPFKEGRQRRGQLAEVDGEPGRGLGTAARDEGGEGLVPALDADGTNVRGHDRLAAEGSAGSRAQAAAARCVPRRSNAREASGGGNGPERDGLCGAELEQQIEE